ncbi:MAG: hypothetical protein HKP59_02520 [Lutibacter sp.]|uniref:hypothetical protein n=1 Tax=Lutibacter sp. TaxID=1925666 RepID=UPI00179ED154|nr:hypothetical protein [Lutibacter sp.]MBT8316479.1 hypothetical protein [Lutibacter sp.]NNJ57339.1 hypothetical protein [Lutibacter sp.]
MVFDTTYNNEDFNEQSVLLLGKSFSFLERIKQGGIGSSRLIIESISPKLDLGKLKFSETDYGNIELRPKGIIVHYTRKLERFSWIIPYYRLVIYNSQFFSIHANGNFIQFSKNKNYIANKKFIDKMIDIKNDYLNLSYYDS